jgi:protein-tyrosine phosphatase
VSNFQSESELDEDPTAFEINFDPTIQRMSGIALHGNTPFDVPFVSEIEPNLYQGGCETGLVLPSFISDLVSLYPWERYKIKHELKSELYVRLYDSTSQAFEQIDAIAAWVNDRRMNGGIVLVHCQAGLNRSSLVAARALMLSEDISGAKAIEVVRAQRSPACLCNPHFESYLRSLDVGYDHAD